MKSFAIGALLPVFVGAAVAQQPAQLIGMTRNTPLVRTQAIQSCQFTGSCSLRGVLPAAGQPWSGGSAFDASSGRLWVSDGRFLARVQPGNCSVDCGPYPVPSIGANAVVTGLAISETRNELLMIDSDGTITTLSLSGSCTTPAIVGSCGTGLQHTARRSTSGLALDDKNGLLFYSYTDFSTGGATRIIVAQLGTNCTAVATVPLVNVSGVAFGPVTGLAVDWCRQIFYATDGLRFVAMRYLWDPSMGTFGFGSPRFCTPPAISPDPYVGLAVLPGGATSVGQPCANGTCRFCPMRHRLLTSPEVGNPNLVAALDQAQDGSLTWLGVGYGHCRQVGPVIPPLCGPVLLPLRPAPLVAGPYPVASVGGGPCSASTRVSIAVPMDPTLCGTQWSSQFLSLCIHGSGTGTAMSNCLSWDLGGS